MRINYFNFPWLLFGVIFLSGCEEARSVFGQTKAPPDEFAVYRRPPLTLPPNFNLRPPSPGVLRPQENSPRDKVRRALSLTKKNTDQVSSVQSTGRDNLSRGEQALLKLTGAENADPNIRQLVEKESQKLFENDKSIKDKIVFWQTKEDFGTVVDPVKEKKRVGEALALGKALQSKDIPTISRKRKALFKPVWN